MYVHWMFQRAMYYSPSKPKIKTCFTLCDLLPCVAHYDVHSAAHGRPWISKQGQCHRFVEAADNLLSSNLIFKEREF